MPDGDGFRVAIKDSVRRVLDAETLPTSGASDSLEFPSRAAAEARIEALSRTETGTLELQRPAPNDPADVDAYLVYYPETRKRDPDGTLEDGWTFDTTANQYGDLGEALVTAADTPALNHFVRQDLADVLEDRHLDRLEVRCVTRPVEFDWTTIRAAADGERPGWTPDCEVRAHLPDRRDPLHRYFCEIKTGEASFERNQAAGMEAVSEIADVLKIRVTIDALPDEYTVKVRRIGDSRPGLDELAIERAPGDQAGLSEFHD